MRFFERETNFPWKSHGVWWLTQFRRWGMVKEAPDYKGIVDKVHRPDIYREVAKEMGVESPADDMKKETFLDGVAFDPTKPEEYAKTFTVNSWRGGTRAEHERPAAPPPPRDCRGPGRLVHPEPDVAPDLPSPVKTWNESKRYILEPFFKEGEMNQGIGRLAYYSLIRVGKGIFLAILIGTPLGFLLGLSRNFYRVVRSPHPDPAADLSAGMAAARTRSSSSARNRPRSSPSRSAPCGRRSLTPPSVSAISIRTT